MCSWRKGFSYITALTEGYQWQIARFRPSRSDEFSEWIWALYVSFD